MEKDEEKAGQTTRRLMRHPPEHMITQVSCEYGTTWRSRYKHPPCNFELENIRAQRKTRLIAMTKIIAVYSQVVIFCGKKLRWCNVIYQATKHLKAQLGAPVNDEKCLFVCVSRKMITP